jgi:hypothetical protein
LASAGTKRMVPHHRPGGSMGIITKRNPRPGEKATAFLASFPSAIYQPLLGVYRDPEPFPCCNSSPRSTAAVSTPVAAGAAAAPLAPARGSGARLSSFPLARASEEIRRYPNYFCSAVPPMLLLGWVSHPAPWTLLFEPQFDCRKEGTADDDGCCCCYHRRCFQAQAKLPCTSTCRRTSRDSGAGTPVLPLCSPGAAYRARCSSATPPPTRLLLTMTIGAAVAAAGRRASADKDDGSRQRCRRRPCLDPARLPPPTRLLPAMTVGVTVAAVGRRASGDGSRQRGRRRLAPGPLVVTARFLHPRHNKPFSGYYFHLAVPRPLLSSLRLGRKGGADDDDGSD